MFRGSKEPLLLDLFPEASTAARGIVADFAATVCRDVPAPILAARPPVRRSRAQQQWQQQQPPPSIRRSERLARKSRHRATKTAVQAQTVMMRRLGLTSDTQPPDASSYQQFTATFSSQLTTSHCDALDALLPAGKGAMAADLVEPAQC